MNNIIKYFNTVLYTIFGGRTSQVNSAWVHLESPSSLINLLSGYLSDAETFEQFVVYLLDGIIHEPSILFSVFVWTWFAVLVFKLLLVYPFKWIRSVVKR